MTQRPMPHRVAEAFDHEIDKIAGSRFLTRLIPADAPEQVLEAQALLRAHHPHSRHVCFAYVGDGPDEVRFSDDGEPSRTAGFPMLKVLQGASMRRTGALVTRYFGGTKLGTGGLVRAYTQAVREALEHCPLLPSVPLRHIVVRCSYAQEPLARHALQAAEVERLQAHYDAQVTLSGRAPDVRLGELTTRLEPAEGFLVTIGD